MQQARNKEDESMPTKQEIVLAIGGHIWWKSEFEKNVRDGWHFFNPDLAERSYETDLGLWLAELAPDGPDWEHFEQVQSLYHEFHEAAAEVVRMAMSGDIDTAEASICTGLYAQKANALTLALKNWMDSVKEEEPRHGLGAMQTKPPNPNPSPDQERLGG